LGPRLSELLGQQIVVENIAGAGGMAGSARVAKASADGYQFLLVNIGTHAHNQSLYKRPLYNAATDFAPVILIAEQTLVLIARNDLPANNLQEFISYARANQATMQYGSAGTGSATHLACVLFNAAIGIRVTHVPYRGGGPAMQDLMAGRLDYQCPLGAAAIPHIESKTVKAIATLTKDRSPSLPNLPSTREQGLANFETSAWNAFFLPKSTPSAVVAKLNTATVATMNTPAVRDRLREIGVDVVAPERRSPGYLQKFVVSEIETWGAAMRAAGVTAE
jgi:tripartite-type tricarboxylate transporter receptor subunit TctC